MKKSVLIIEATGKNKLSEEFIKACVSNPNKDINFYVAKTQLAASLMLKAHPDIVATITETEDGPKLDVLDSAKFSRDETVKADAASDSLLDSPSDSLLDFPSDLPPSCTGSFDEILTLLEKHGLLKDKKHTCMLHEQYAATISDLKSSYNNLLEKVSDLGARLERTAAEISACPVKKSLISKALDSNKESKFGCSGPVIIASISLIGVIITALSGLLGKLVEIVLPYISSGTP